MKKETDGSKQKMFSLRLHKDLVADIKKHQDRLQKQLGMKLTLTAVVEKLINSGLEDAEEKMSQLEKAMGERS